MQMRMWLVEFDVDGHDPFRAAVSPFSGVHVL